jgi:hypothetical protein
MLLLLVQRVQQVHQEFYRHEKIGLFTQLKQSLGSTSFWFKVIILVVCAPLWWPIMKALLREIDSALRKDGGILARTYTARDLKNLEERYGRYEDPLKSIPRTGRDERRAAAGRPAAAPRAAGKPPPAGGGSTGRSMRSQRTRGF